MITDIEPQLFFRRKYRKAHLTAENTQIKPKTGQDYFSPDFQSLGTILALLIKRADETVRF
jgi:hypothetical protein